jgi:NitT/TauT family transport system ATP-binding protein
MLSLRDITQRFPRLDRPVLDGVRLDIARGEFVSLLGPSGCGKTTLLRIAGGLQPPTAGEIFLDGERRVGPSPDRGMVFQHFNLFPWRTALGNAAYGLEMQGVPKPERLLRAREYLRLLGLEAFADHYPAEISGGMKQRVGIARALAIEPKILLMDEPFGALDALTREYLQVELMRLCESRGLTVLFVTHSIDEAIMLSDRIVVMGAYPTRIIRELTVELPRPRWNADIRGTPQYTSLRSLIWSLLEKEIARSTTAAPAE